MEKLKKAINLLKFLLNLSRAEYRCFRQAIRDILTYWKGRVIDYIVLRYNCLKIRRRMLEVKTTREWESYAKLLDYLEGCMEWK